MTESNPEILVNGEQQEEQQNIMDTPQEILSSLSQDAESLEDSGAAEKDTQAKMQSVFHQVRNQIRSQVSVKVSKNSILELVQKVRDREAEIIRVSSEPESKDVNGDEEKQALTDNCKDQMDLKEERLRAIFEEKLEASQKALKDEFQAQISQVRKEMQAYTEQALKDLECKMQTWQSHNLQHTHPEEQQGGKAPDKKQKPSAAPSLAFKRGRVLTRTMTTIIPKTCAPVIIGPRAKSETLSSSKGESSRCPLKDPVFSSSGNKPYQSRKPLPPARPRPQQPKKPIQAKATTGASLDGRQRKY